MKYWSLKIAADVVPHQVQKVVGSEHRRSLVLIVEGRWFWL